MGIVLGGLKGPVTVNGETYDGIMPSQGHLSDEDVAAVLTYVRSSWGNAGDEVTREEIATKRASGVTAWR